MYTQEDVDFKNNLYLASLKYFSKFSDVELNRMMLMHDCISTNEIKSCVYFILDRERKLVKIGKTKNLTDRFSQITNAYRFCGLDYIFALCDLSNILLVSRDIYGQACVEKWKQKEGEVDIVQEIIQGLE